MAAFLAIPLVASGEEKPRHTWARVFCVTETAILSVVDAELDGGAAGARKRLRELSVVNQCMVSQPVPVVLVRLIHAYEDYEGKESEVWEAASGLYTVVYAESVTSPSY